MSEVKYIAHHGIRGQRWGVRRYQNEDGSLTSAGRERYGSGNGEEKSFKFNNKRVRVEITRYNNPEKIRRKAEKEAEKKKEAEQKKEEQALKDATSPENIIKSFQVDLTSLSENEIKELTYKMNAIVNYNRAMSDLTKTLQPAKPEKLAKRVLKKVGPMLMENLVKEFSQEAPKALMRKLFPKPEDEDKKFDKEYYKKLADLNKREYNLKEKELSVREKEAYARIKEREKELQKKENSPGVLDNLFSNNRNTEQNKPKEKTEQNKPKDKTEEDKKKEEERRNRGNNK